MSITRRQGLLSVDSLRVALGVLQADTNHLATDQTAGISWAVIEIGWDAWEPTQGTFSSSYKSQILSKITAYKQAGYKVAAVAGLQYAPQWVYALTNGYYIDQDGYTSDYGNSPRQANLIWSVQVRAAATTYLNDLVATVGSQLDNLRIGTSDGGECYILNPAASPNAAPNGESWWAFDAAAQGSAANLPTGIGACPMPAWIPGSSSWSGGSVTTSLVTNWWNWYFGALVNCLEWQINTYRAAGYSGPIQCPMPGTGLGPTVHDTRINQLLAPYSSDGGHTMNTAAAWYLLVPLLTAYDANLVIDCSSIGDGSGSPANNLATASDLSYTLTQADPWNSHWSAVRFMHYLVVKNGNVPLFGESVGSNSASDVPTIVAQARSCHVRVCLWAFDDQLYDGTHATLAEVTTGFGV